METRSTAKRRRITEDAARPPPAVERPPSPTPPPPRARRPDPLSPSITHPTGLHSLPVAILLDQIFSWLAPPANIPHDLMARGLDPWTFNWKLVIVQQVCRAWHWHAKALAARYAAHVWQLHKNDVVYHLTKPLPPRPTGQSPVVQLQIVLSYPGRGLTMGAGRSAYFQIRGLPDDWHQFIPSTYWREVFLACPALVRLDLSRVPFDEALLASILDTASTLCPNVQSLVLPIHTSDLEARWMDEQTNLLDLLARVLPKWHASCGGLSQLSLPWYEFRTAAGVRRVIEIVAAHCPRIRFFRDWTHHTDFYDDDPRDWTGAGEVLDTNLDTWRFACTSLLAIEEFYWRMPPECAPFVKTFAESVRPAVKTMYLDYTIRVGVEVRYPALRAKTVAAFFEATPNLEQFSLVTERYYVLQLDLATPHDVIVTQLVKHCPRLQSLRIDIGVPTEDRSKVPAVTDVGVREILRLRYLRVLCISPVALSDRGIEAVLDACMTRELHDIEITLSPVDDETSRIEHMLRYLLDWDSSMCSTRPRFVFRVDDLSADDFTPEMLLLLQSLAADLQEKWRPLGHDVVATIDDHGQREMTLRWNFSSDKFAPRRRAVPSRPQLQRSRELHPHFDRFRRDHPSFSDADS